MADGLFKNPGFELGDAHWTKGTGWTIGTTGERSGAYCAACNASTTSSLVMTETFAVRPGCLVNMEAYVYGLAATGGTVTVGIEWFDKDGASISINVSSALAHGATWTLKSVSAYAPGKAKFATGRVIMNSGNGSTWYVDDVNLTGEFIETLPTSAKIQTHRIVQADTVAVFEPLVGDKKFSEFNAGMSDGWAGVINLIPLKTGGNLESVLAFLSRIGLVDRFFIYDPDRRVPVGGVVNGLLVDGANQVGHKINVKGGTPDTTPLVAGDYVEIANQYFELRRDLILGPLGTGILQVWPALRSSPVDEEPVITDNPKMVARATVRPERSSGVRPVTELSISFMEVL